MPPPTFFCDVNSPYSWMAEERIGELIPDADWRPLYTPLLLRMIGREMWVLTDEREPRMAEIVERAERYGLPPVRWPTALPQRAIDLARAATVAKRHGKVAEFAIAASRAIYTEGRDVSDPDGIRELCGKVGLDADEVLERIATQEVKDEVRATIDEAHALGVKGIPTVVVGGELFWGDDRLDGAAAAARTTVAG